MRYLPIVFIFLFFSPESGAQLIIAGKGQSNAWNIGIAEKQFISGSAYALQWNFLNIAVLKKDPYNLSTNVVSRFALYSDAVAMGTAYLFFADGKALSGLPALFPDSSGMRKVIHTIGYILLAPIVAANTYHYYRISPGD